MLKSCRRVGWWDLIDSFWIWGLAFGLGLRLGLVNTVKFNSTTNCFADGVWNMMVDGGNTARIIGVGLIWYNVRIVGAPLMLNKTQPMRWIPRRDGGGHQPIRAPKHHCQPMVGCGGILLPSYSQILCGESIGRSENSLSHQVCLICWGHLEDHWKHHSPVSFRSSTRDYKWLQGTTSDYKRLQGTANKGLHARDLKGLHTRDFKQETSSKGLHPRDYKGLEV